MSRPTLNPLFIDSSHSSHGLSDSKSSHEQSSTGYVSSTLDNKSQTSSTNAKPTSSNDKDVCALGSVALRRGTTRDLIGIFEQQSFPQASLTSPLARHPLKRTGKAQRTSLEAPLPSLPKSNPLRQSFRNLLTAFNKAKKTFATHASTSGDETNSALSMYRREPTAQKDATFGHPQTTSVAKQSTLSRLCPELPPDLRNGILLYYDHDPTSPAWHRCTAFLAPPNLRLDYFNPSGRPTTRTISMVGGVDARSIASTNCAAIAPPSLDERPPHVFEIEFEGGITEKFAAASVLERSGWVSSIWDSILLNKRKNPPRSMHGFGETDLVSSPSRGSTNGTATMAKHVLRYPSKHSELQGLSGKVGSPSSSARTNEDGSASSWMTTEESLTRSPSVRKIHRMSIVKQRLARWDTPPIQQNGATAGEAYATPPRTPPSAKASAVSFPMTPRDASLQPTVSSVGCELASPRPIRAIVSSLLSNTDTGSTYEDEITIVTGGIGSREEVEGSQRASQPMTVKIGASQHDQLISSTPANLKGYHQAYSRSSQQGYTDSDESPKFRRPNESIIERQPSFHDLTHRITQIHEELKLALQQPPLPIPQLDGLRDQIEELAKEVHSADFEALHATLGRLEERAQESTLHDETRRPGDEVSQKIDGIMQTLENLMDKVESERSHLPLIQERLDTIQEHIERHDAPPPVPLKDESSETQETRGEIQKKLDRLETILTDMRQYQEEAKTATAMSILKNESPASLSVFTKRSGTPPQSAQVPTEIHEILALVKDGQTERGVIASQFEDSVRYLNELHKWMEAFVAKTDAQEQILHKIADGLSQSSTTMHNLKPDTQSAAGSADALSELKSSMQSVLSAIEEDIRQHAHFRESQGLATVLLAIEKNQKEQKVLFRGIAEGLSADIRGERLRFVDAMKDATSVNVAIHLEEFKRQLSVEVTNMLQEVGKTARSRERNYLEKEIGEIFNQQVERRQSMAFQPFMHLPPSSAPTRPHSGGPYPAFMAPPGVRSISQSTQPFYPVGLHPTASGIYSRPLPTPSLYEPSPQPAPSRAPTTPLQRRKA